MKISHSKRQLAVNTFFLYLLMFSTYFFGFISLPLQTRVLGAETYGRIGFAMAVASYFSVLIDFGFIMYATAEVAKLRDNLMALREIHTAVAVAKTLLFLLSLLIFLPLSLFYDQIRDNLLLCLLFILNAYLTSIVPNFLYRGMERMKSITIRTVLLRFAFTALVYLFLRKKEQYILIPIFQIISSILALLYVWWDLNRNFHISMTNIKISSALQMIKSSGYFFYSRAAICIYDTTNTIILNSIYPAAAEVGYYTTSNRTVSMLRSGFSPISDSLYPYMVKNKDFRLVKKLLLILVPPVLIACITIAFFAEELCAFVFGAAFRPAGSTLRALLPLVVLAPLTYLLGFPTLTPLGLQSVANFSTVAAAGVQIAGFVVLSLIGKLTLLSICWLSCTSETCILIIRLFAIVRYRYKRQLRADAVKVD